jgi:hypothetical protein
VGEAGDAAGEELGKKLGKGAGTAGKNALQKEADKLSLWWLTAFAAMPAGAAIGGVAAAGAVSLIGAAIVGLGALTLRNNQQMTDSFGALWTTIREGAKSAAKPLAEDLAHAGNQLRTVAVDLQPELYKLFAGAEPAVEQLTDGVARFAKNVMPGFVIAVRTSEPAMEGFADLLADTGQGLTDFFTNTSTAGASTGQILTSTGRIVRDLLGFAGAFFAQLSNIGSPAVITLEGFMRQLEGTLLSLGSGAFPVLTNGASGFLTAGMGVLRLLQLMSPVLGPLIGMVGTFAASLKLVDLVTFGSVSSGLTAVKTAVKEADGAGGKLKAGFGALAAGPLPLLGIAAVGLSFILDGLGKKQREAAEAAQYHDSIVRKLSGTLNKTTGAITDQTRAEIADQVAKDKIGKASSTMADQAKKVGATQGMVVDAIMNTNGALSRMDGSLRTTVESQIRSVTSAQELKQIQDSLGLSMEDLTTIYLGGAGGVDTFQRQLQDFDAALDQNDDHVTSRMSGLGLSMQGATLDSRNLWGGITQLNGGLGDAVKQAIQAAQGMGQLTPAQLEAKAKADALKASFDILKDAFKSVAEKGQAVVDVLDRISGKEPDLREAIQAWDDLMRGVGKDTDWNTAAEGVQKLSGSLVDMKGEVNTTTEAGSKLQDWATSAQTDFANTAAAMRAAGVPADEMSAKLGTMRQQFIDNAVAQGLPRDAAIRLADAYHLVPPEVVTAMYAPGLIERMAELGILHGKIVGLPDGRFAVTADASPANGVIQKLITDYQGKVIRLTVSAGGVVHNLTGGGRPFLSEGGWVEGPGTTTSDSIPKMLSRREFVVNAADAAEYAPILEAINDGRRPIMPAGEPTGPPGGAGTFMPAPMATADGGDTYVTNYFTINVPSTPTQDMNALVELLSRRIERRLRQGKGS